MSLKEGFGVVSLKEGFGVGFRWAVAAACLLENEVKEGRGSQGGVCGDRQSNPGGVDSRLAGPVPKKPLTKLLFLVAKSNLQGLGFGEGSGWGRTS